jgi:bridging integrator 3
MAREIYEDLNEQLTAELPQLIDLRVPYLDPSFEALVKIQLRFCKEGYERMAQVQQYLEPQVREDYAQVTQVVKWLMLRERWTKKWKRCCSRCGI